MLEDPIVYTVFLVFSGGALVATLALFARQALPVAYILLGVVFGPSVLGLVTDAQMLRAMAHIGIMFLLFLMGLELNPRELLLLMRKTTVVTVGSAAAFGLVGALVAVIFGFGPGEALIVGAAMGFSSTIVGLKLLPTTVLHNQRTGEIVISVLLFQDLIAILMLLVLRGGGEPGQALWHMARMALALPLLAGAAALVVRFVLLPLLRTFDVIKEYVFLLAIGWCLGLAQLSSSLGLSAEIGAFVAGVTLAVSPVSWFIAESLKPLRDFFLVLFFFSLGAGFDLALAGRVLLPALLLACLMLVLKPPVFRWLLLRVGEEGTRAREVGVRLGQLSEFSLLLAVLAHERGQIGAGASYLIQLATLLTFLVSTYVVVLRYPTPIALTDELRRD
jgi:Kef-type K+ transport system membrane component KefB